MLGGADAASEQMMPVTFCHGPHLVLQVYRPRCSNDGTDHCGSTNPTGARPTHPLDASP